MEMANPPFRISPSTVARYFYHDCERFLYFSAVTPEERRRQGLPRPAFDRSPLVGAMLESGFRWEEEVIQQHLKGKVFIGPGKGALHTRRISPAKTLEQLGKLRPGRYIYQPTIEPPPLFYETYGLDPGLVILSDNHPDLIAAVEGGEAGGTLLRIVDVKRGEELRLTHRIQILLYALELESWLEAEGITGFPVDLEQGAVWLGQQQEPMLFPLADFRPHLERFLREDLFRVLSQPAREARWHLYDRCEWCDFFSHCQKEMTESDDVSQVPRLTVQGKRHLQQEAGVHTLVQLGHFLRRGDADEILERCASLRGQRLRLQAHVEALRSDEPQVHGASAPDLPRGENLGVFLTLQREPLSQGIYLAGLHVQARDEIREHLFSGPLEPLADGEPCLFLARSANEVARVRQQFLDLLEELFRQVHAYNESCVGWKDQLSLQVYVHTEKERALLFACLLEGLKEEGLKEKATTLLCHLQGPELLEADRHPQSEVDYPVVVLQNAVHRLLALPVEVSYTLPEILQALGSTYHYRRRDYYHFPLGHGLRAEAVHAAWYQGKTDNLNEILKQARLYLFAVAALLRAVREQAGAHLFRWPPRFSLPTGSGLRHPLLSRLAFLARHESLLRCLAVREARVEARDTLLLQGQVLELRARSANEMEVVGGTLEPEADGFPAWLLVRDDAEGRRAQLEYADYWYRRQMYGGPASPHRACVRIEEVRSQGNARVLRLGYARAFQGSPARRGERFLLYQRFTDFTTDPIVTFLEELDQETSQPGRGGLSLLLAVLEGPTHLEEEARLPARVARAVEINADRLGFTPSQREAYLGMARQRVTAVWGPPGTGKTHFLASALVGLVEAHRQAGRPFRVLATAFTHAAIENLLRKLAQRVQALPSVREELALGKAKYWQGANQGIDVVPEKLMAGWLRDNPVAVLGATVYSCLKKRNSLTGFDLVIIDEASQVRVPEAVAAIAQVSGEGRLVLAGDPLQLPPIVAGSYPDPRPGEPLLHRSIFEALCPPRAGAGPLTLANLGTDGNGLVRPLFENFRMNEVLTGFAARLLYGPRYRCNDEVVARRRLNLRRKRGMDPLVWSCLDPEYPLVVVILEGIRATRANPIEADLIAQLVVALREGVRDESGKPYASDADFFRRGVFIVSPHRAQIRAIQQELAARRTWQSLPFVDTVDKMQGQEADAVLVSYGVADQEFALQEAEFIYGLNRLNVAITRARTKSIVCLPRPLLDASAQVLENERAAQGLAFMRRLVSELERVGEELAFEGEDVEARVLRASAAPALAHHGRRPNHHEHQEHKEEEEA
jgi:DNA replication ATP-dependent helicase Dna2